MIPAQPHLRRVSRTGTLAVSIVLISVSFGCAKTETAPTPVLETVVTVTSGGVGTFNFAGQSVAAPTSSYYTGLRFSWYTFQRAPTAFGSLYLLTQEYLGLPGNLSPATPGFVAQSERTEAGEYVFDPHVTLIGGTRYWFYTDTQGSFTTSFNRDIYAGGDLYVTGVSSLPFRKSAALSDADFTLRASVHH